MSEFTPEQEQKLDRLVDARGYSYDDARRELGLGDEGSRRSTRKAGSAAVERTVKKPRHSRRGGRSYPEPSDSELDPHWNVSFAVSQTPEQKAAMTAFQEEREQERRAVLIRDLALASDDDRVDILVKERVRYERAGGDDYKAHYDSIMAELEAYRTGDT